MKKYLSLFLLIFLFHYTRAQDWTKTVIGAKCGINLANIGGVDTDNAMKLSGHIGPYAEGYLMDMLRIQLEILLSGQGHAAKTNNDSKLKLIYLNIPLTAKFYPAKHINLHAGPQLGLLLSAKSEYLDVTSDVKQYFRGIDLGLALGAGYDFNLIGRDMNVTLRYIHGLTNISDDSTFKRYNRVIQLSLGIMIADLMQGS